jgi:hypothetical protein
MNIASPKDYEIHKVFKKKYLKKNHLEFLDNKHKCMKVVHALGQIY